MVDGEGGEFGVWAVPRYPSILRWWAGVDSVWPWCVSNVMPRVGTL